MFNFVPLPTNPFVSFPHLQSERNKDNVYENEKVEIAASALSLWLCNCEYSIAPTNAFGSDKESVVACGQCLHDVIDEVLARHDGIVCSDTSMEMEEEVLNNTNLPHLLDAQRLGWIPDISPTHFHSTGMAVDVTVSGGLSLSPPSGTLQGHLFTRLDCASPLLAGCTLFPNMDHDTSDMQVDSTAEAITQALPFDFSTFTQAETVNDVIQPFTEPATGPELIAAPDLTTEAATAPEPTTESAAAPEPTTELDAEPGPTTESAAAPGPTTEAATEPGPTTEPATEPGPTTEPDAEPAAVPEPTTEPDAEPGPTTELDAEPGPTTEAAAAPGPTTEPATEPEPTTESAVAPEPITESAAAPEPTTEPATEPGPTTEPDAEPAAVPEPTTEPDLSTMSASESERDEGAPGASNVGAAPIPLDASLVTPTSSMPGDKVVVQRAIMDRLSDHLFYADTPEAYGSDDEAGAQVTEEVVPSLAPRRTDANADLEAAQTLVEALVSSTRAGLEKQAGQRAAAVQKQWARDRRSLQSVIEETLGRHAELFEALEAVRLHFLHEAEALVQARAQDRAPGPFGPPGELAGSGREAPAGHEQLDAALRRQARGYEQLIQDQQRRFQAELVARAAPTEEASPPCPFRLGPSNGCVERGGRSGPDAEEITPFGYSSPTDAGMRIGGATAQTAADTGGNDTRVLAAKTWSNKKRMRPFQPPARTPTAPLATPAPGCTSERVPPVEKEATSPSGVKPIIKRMRYV